MNNKKVRPTLNLPLFNAGGDQIDYTLYDSMALNNAGGAVDRDFFAVGLNQVDGVTNIRKTIAMTNVRAGQIPEGQAMAVFAMKFWYEPIDERNAAERQSFMDWLRTTTVEILIESKNQYGTWKLSELWGAKDLSVVEAAGAGDVITLGDVGQSMGLKKFNLYIPLPRLTTYNVRLRQTVAPAAGLDGDFITCGLVGVLNRTG